jgi:hypothetical protein
VIAKEYYLPPLPPVSALLCERAGSETRASALVKHLAALFFKGSNPPTVKETRGVLLKANA